MESHSQIMGRPSLKDNRHSSKKMEDVRPCETLGPDDPLPYWRGRPSEWYHRMIGLDVEAIRQQSVQLDQRLATAAEQLTSLQQELVSARDARQGALSALGVARGQVARLLYEVRVAELGRAFTDGCQAREEKAQLLVIKWCRLYPSSGTTQTLLELLICRTH